MTIHLSRVSFFAVFVSLCVGLLHSQEISKKQVAEFKKSVQHIVVIYQENWSFDALYGSFPGAEGRAAASPESLSQKDKNGVPLTSAPAPLIGKVVDPQLASLDLTKALQPYDLSTFLAADAKTGDLIHRFYTQQLQVDGGKMDKFVAWSDNGGLVMSYFDVKTLPEGKLAADYTLCDHFFQGAFGGSFLNHHWLVAAATPVFPNAPAGIVSIPPDPDGTIVVDKAVTPDGYAVNTCFSVNHPIPASVKDPATLLPNLTNPTIGDRLNDKNISWAWFSGGWDDALAGKPDPTFQFHHQPFMYYYNFRDGTENKKNHLKDETDFLHMVANGTLPAVSFVKPLGINNEHPGYASLQQGQQHVNDLIDAIKKTDAWKNTVIIITYDENGGRWDHVAPPIVDRWGPGIRVPTVIISPLARKHYVDHTVYDTTSILKLIETRFDLKSLSDRDANAGNLLHALQF